jgi:hypothetical protein
MIYIARCGCGCCEAELFFNTEENINAAFEKAGLSSSATIVDDNNIAHEGIDTFYGYRLVDEAKHDLSYLVKQLDTSVN